VIASGRDAVRHASDLARIKSWRAAAAVRSAVIRAAVGLCGLAFAAAATVTFAAWATARFLEEVSRLGGGGLQGLALAVAVMLILVVGLALAVRSLSLRARKARWRARLAGEAGATKARGEQAELEALERRVQEELRRDGEKIVELSGAALRRHPLVGMGLGVASGFLGVRALRSGGVLKRALLRVIVTGSRVLRAAGMTWGMQALRARGRPRAQSSGVRGAGNGHG
jgi:hypothetical protein